MDYEFEQSTFSATILTGLLAGIIGAVVNFFIFIAFTSPTVQNATPGLINPFSLFFGSIFPALIAGIIFSFVSHLRLSELLYYIIVGTGFSMVVIALNNTNLLSDATAEKRFHKIFMVMTSIIGVLTLSIPYFVKHPKLLKNVI